MSIRQRRSADRKVGGANYQSVCSVGLSSQPAVRSTQALFVCSDAFARQFEILTNIELKTIRMLSSPVVDCGADEGGFILLSASSADSGLHQGPILSLCLCFLFLVAFLILTGLSGLPEGLPDDVLGG